MTDIKQCPGCKGARKILGMGMLSQDCSICNGVGHIQNKETKKEEVITEGEPVVTEVKKKKGRPFGTSNKQ